MNLEKINLISGEHKEISYSTIDNEFSTFLKNYIVNNEEINIFIELLDAKTFKEYEYFVEEQVKGFWCSNDTTGQIDFPNGLSLFLYRGKDLYNAHKYIESILSMYLSPKKEADTSSPTIDIKEDEIAF